MNLFKFFSLKKKSKLTPNQQLELERINRIRLRTMKHELNEQQYLSMLDTVKTMQKPKDQRYHTMYDG